MGEARGTTRQRVYDELRRRIVTLQYPPKAAISEKDLAGELGVSRTPVRESLLKLREEGFVQVFPQMGTFVSHVDIDRVSLAQFIREAIECTALAGFVQTDESTAHLDALHENLAAQHRVAADGGDLAEFFQLDEAFHLELLKLTDHESAWPVVAAEKGHLDRARQFGLVIHPIEHLIEQHQGVIDGVESGELGQAVTVLRQHLREILIDLAKVRDQNPEIFDSLQLRPVRRLVTTLEPR
ncbi:GntR family transcriptional regulator [Propionimicrobium sp. PCR01-08-3]|uniref:GntR family transcriptional regulator n=1 Tax=Propionimicrobium sp. PCR01-08-3 TaxID=3052086 RepID=UPI00255C86BC|nr:GntR family transcriptional regulator [Propionimicrobium sp. PCR01-08-3]WIY81829.1 GntR family transcriptional regulator [Propionimicrobium sp. PCR01-08-3]